jgi:flagellar M-ring protein FliF
MSLAVLVDHYLRWEGVGPDRRRVLDAPPPEILQTIRDLVAALTGFNAERGDQITVESLPFESSRNAEPSAEPVSNAPVPSRPTPVWWQQLQQRKEIIGAVAGAVVLLLLVLRLFIRRMWRKRSPLPAVAPEQLAGSAASLGSLPASSALVPAGAGARALNEGSVLELASRVRNFTENEAAVAANVVRLWLHESEHKA